MDDFRDIGFWVEGWLDSCIHLYLVDLVFTSSRASWMRGDLGLQRSPSCGPAMQTRYAQLFYPLLHIPSSSHCSLPTPALTTNNPSGSHFDLISNNCS